MHIHGDGRCLRARRRFVAARLSVLALSFFVLIAVGLDNGAAAFARWPFPFKADRIVVLKSARKLELLKNGVVLRVFPIALGGDPIGPKHFRGDDKTPEGLYYIDERQANSAYHLGLRISYPNAADRAYAEASGRDPGGNIFIHGLPNWYRGSVNPIRFYKDWTDGCISVGDRAIEEIWDAVDLGTPIEIKP